MTWSPPTISTTIICYTPRAPICCAASVCSTNQRRVTCVRSPSSPTIASAVSSSADCAKSSLHPHEKARRHSHAHLFLPATADGPRDLHRLSSTKLQVCLSRRAESPGWRDGLGELD